MRVELNALKDTDSEGTEASIPSCTFVDAVELMYRDGQKFLERYTAKLTAMKKLVRALSLYIFNVPDGLLC